MYEYVGKSSHGLAEYKNRSEGFHVVRENSGRLYYKRGLDVTLRNFSQKVRPYVSDPRGTPTTFRKKVGWIEVPPVKEPPPQSVVESQPLPGPEPAPEVSALLSADPKVHTTATIAAQEVDDDDEFQRKRRRNWAR